MTVNRLSLLIPSIGGSIVSHLQKDKASLEPSCSVRTLPAPCKSPKARFIPASYKSQLSTTPLSLASPLKPPEMSLPSQSLGGKKSRAVGTSQTTVMSSQGRESLCSVKIQMRVYKKPPTWV